MFLLPIFKMKKKQDRVRRFLWPLIDSTYQELGELVNINRTQLRERDIGKHEPTPKNYEKIVLILKIKQEEISTKIMELENYE